MLTDHDWLQIEQAANGCISGDLSEWPDLARAFKNLGVGPTGLPGHKLIPHAHELQCFCQGILAMRNFIEGDDSPTSSGTWSVHPRAS